MTPRPTLVFARQDAVAASNHRIANSVATAAGLSRLQGSRISNCGRSLDIEEASVILAELGDRIDAAACLHRRLADRPDEAAIEIGACLQDLAAAVVAALAQDGGIRLQFACDGHCLLPPEQALKIGFIVVELLTNAVQYAHPTGVPGDIKVSCRRGRDGTVTVEVSDDGVGLPEGLDPMEAGSLGLQLVRSLAAQLDARLGFANDGLGLSCVLQVPGEPHA